MATTNSVQTVKNFSGLNSLDDVTSQLDLVFSRLFDQLDAKPQTTSLLNGKQVRQQTKPGDFVLNYQTGKVVAGMSDGKTIQPLDASGLGGTITDTIHGALDSQVLNPDGSVNFILHPVATDTVLGFMSSADKTKLDTFGVLANGTPTGVDASAGTSGTSVNISRSDHEHQLSVGTPTTIGTANAAGSAISSVRSDHVHAHGNQTVGTLHAAVTGSVNGFMIAADKTKLDSYSITNVAGTNFFNVLIGGTNFKVALT